MVISQKWKIVGSFILAQLNGTAGKQFRTFSAFDDSAPGWNTKLECRVWSTLHIPPARHAMEFKSWI
jgi:hypothetical protein